MVAEFGVDRIGAITTAGVVTEYPLPSGAEPEGITLGPDGALWFTEYGGNRIGRITTTGKLTQEPVLPGAGSEPENIVTGPDGALWFTEFGGGRIGRITTGGGLREFPVPSQPAGPDGITVGPDGALWFTEYYGDAIGRVTTAGVVNQFGFPTGAAHPESIVRAGNVLWFTESAADKIAQIATDGSVTEIGEVPGSGPDGLAVGTDGALWITTFFDAAILRMQLPAAATVLVLPSAPAPAKATVPLGTQAGWLFETRSSVSDASGMSLFASGTQQPGSTYRYRYAAAGTYAFREAGSAASALVSVPMSATSTTGGTTTHFALTWAQAPAAGLRYDVTVEAPGSSTFVAWQSGVTAMGATFIPTHGSGTYSLRARSRTLAGVASAWSPLLVLTVH